MAYPPVVIVDRKNRPTGLAMLRDAWAQGLLYQVVGILVEDEDGRILLQKRSANMELDPGTWDLSSGGHVDEGHTYDSAATLELQEELGLQDAFLQDLGVEFYSYSNKDRKMNNFLKLYRLVVVPDTVFRADGHEVASLRWFTKRELAELFERNPGHISLFLHQIRKHRPELFAP